MLLNNRKQLVTRPSASSSNRLPTTLTNRRPVMHRNRLRTRDHHRVQRHLLEPVFVLLTHRASLDVFKTDRAHVNQNSVAANTITAEQAMSARSSVPSFARTICNSQ